MEARTILLTSLVLVLWTSTTSALTCSEVPDGPYCQTCWQPVECIGGSATKYPPCLAGEACTVDAGTPFCAPHGETECACTGAGDQCDVYNPSYIEHCSSAAGPILVAPCTSPATLCYNDQCRTATCNNDQWNLLKPECNAAYYCDTNGVVINKKECPVGQYMNSNYECAPAPPPACDGSCSGKCPNPVDCTKFFVCQGTTVIGTGDCVAGDEFDIITNTCMTAGTGTCAFLDGCALTVGLGITATHVTSTTTDGSGFTVPPAGTCNSSTVGSKYPYDYCSRQYYVCAELDNGQYEYIMFSCIGDLFFDTDPTNPYCTPQDDILTCV